MVANVAFLAALTTFLAVAWVAGELSFLAPFKAGIFRNHGVTIGVAITLLFLNLCAAYYEIARWLFLRDAGRNKAQEWLDNNFDSVGSESSIDLADVFL